MRWIEDTLIKHPDFALSRRKGWLKRDVDYEIVLIDAAETPIERPKKREKHFYFEKNRLKSQMVVDKKVRAFANGKRHDFRFFKESSA